VTAHTYLLEIRPRIPERIRRLAELAEDLYYSWSSQVRSLFLYLDAELWASCGHNPKVFLRRIAQSRLEEAAHDLTFLEAYNRALAEYDTYMSESQLCNMGRCLDPKHDLVAYFCLEFGLHESVPIYSGGLGILAGDHCKAASDLEVPLVAVGLLYRHGYFTQEIDRYGNQIVRYPDTDFGELPVRLLRDPQGQELRVAVPIAEREVWARVWEAKVGKIRLILLDTDLEDNTEADRAITYQLYAGDRAMRIQQELVLGVGGVRALEALGLAPSVWHINEGHAAFLVIERCAQQVAQGLPFSAAWELVAAATVFTTHTPVAAGHDVFERGLVEHMLAWAPARLGIEFDTLFRLGRAPGTEWGLNMTALALRGSRHCNGVSRIHGGVASRMESYVWTEVPPEENPLGYVTNGVHLFTFLSSRWRALFDLNLGGNWRNQILNADYWRVVDEIPDYAFWSTRQSMKQDMLEFVRRHACRQFRKQGLNPIQIEHLTQLLDPKHPEVLVLGFARRFASYKRADLLFQDPERLRRILNDPQRPVLVLMAGKAHPNDEEGQALLRRIHEIGLQPEFQGKVLVLEDYNLALARWLVTGVDVWLNTPEYPLEACGTSGQKAAINGVLNLSVLDGWWPEAYDGENGWAIQPAVAVEDPAERRRIEADALMDLLEEQVIPLYFRTDGDGYSKGWVRRSKASMRTVIPRFNAGRMLRDYAMGYYRPARDGAARLAADGAKGARELAQWKARVRELWPGVALRRIDDAPRFIGAGEPVHVRLEVDLAGLRPDDLLVECLVGHPGDTGECPAQITYRLQAEPWAGGRSAVFTLDFVPELSGLICYRFRAYPYHPALSHPLEMGRMRWA